MRLVTTTIPLVIYVVGFQTLVYLLLPIRFRPTWAPLVTSSVGAGVVLVAAIWFGPTAVGLANPDGGLLAAFMSGFAWLDSESGAVTPFHDPEPHPPGNRLNDGKRDRRGRLLAGTMDNEEILCTGTLYRLDPDLSVAVMCAEVHLSNGLGWSPDDRLLYYTDSLRRTISLYDYDLAAGAIDNRRVFATVPEDAGVPDGLCVDAEAPERTPEILNEIIKDISIDHG